MDVNGLLYSQIGYDLKDPMRALLRSTDSNYVTDKAYFNIIDIRTGQIIINSAVKYWGDLWKSSWWEINFSELSVEGEYKIIVYDQGIELCHSDPFKVAKNLLWNNTIIPVALSQLEERAKRSRNGIGWKDCGADWREVNSHATMLIGLTDLLSMGYEWLSKEDTNRLVTQLIHGCDYLGICQDKAESIGYLPGAIVHEIPNHMLVIPGDLAQCTVALARVSRFLTDVNAEKSSEYFRRAIKTFEYLLHTAAPYGKDGFSAMNHGAPSDFVPNSFMTRDLLMMMWGGIELWASGQLRYKETVIELAKQVMNRQIPKEKKEEEYYGHFYAFDNCEFSEKANTHHHVGHDTGSTFPHYLIPFMEMTSRWYDHPDVNLWIKTIKNFANGYFLPACSKNPFYLLPEGYFTGEGLLSFCGPWHGINSSIGFAAALATRLSGYTDDPRLKDIAVGNIQWIAGLNAGITRESFGGCVCWKEDLPPGLAIPYSQIHGIGNRSVGIWTDIKGTIPNGFSVNPQFQLVVKPTAENDGPWLYTDEDWIPHAAGWISALVTLRQSKMLS